MAIPQPIDRAVKLLLGGGVVAFPTETVYGLGALTHHREAITRIFAMKSRPTHRAPIVHIHSPAALDVYTTNVPDYARKLGDVFWPGPLALVLERRPTVPSEITGRGSTVAVRIPDHPVALELIGAVSSALGNLTGIAAPSANRFGEPPPVTAEEVVARLAPAGRPDGPDLILDGGRCEYEEPSTMLLCTGDVPRLLRRGAISVEAIEACIGRWVDR